MYQLTSLIFIDTKANNNKHRMKLKVNKTLCQATMQLIIILEENEDLP